MYPAAFINWIGETNLIRDKETGQWLVWPDEEKDWVVMAETLEELYQIYLKEHEN